jgi:hypothetical protein
MPVENIITVQFVEVGAAPPNNGMQLTIKSDTPFAKRRAKGAPLLLAADPWR